MWLQRSYNWQLLLTALEILVLSRGISTKRMGKKQKGWREGRLRRAVVFCELCSFLRLVRYFTLCVASLVCSPVCTTLIYRPTILCLEIEKLNPFRAFFFFCQVWYLFSFERESPSADRQQCDTKHKTASLGVMLATPASNLYHITQQGRSS